MEETNRQKKIAGVIQRDLAQVIQDILKKAGQSSVIVSVSKVRVTTDLSIAKAYISIFPNDQAKQLLAELQEIKSQIKHQIALKTKNQLRKMPDLALFLDDSLEHIEGINKAIKGDEDPIKNPDLLGKRKKS